LKRRSPENELTTDDKKSRRLRERIRLSLPVRVMCRETLDHEWTEMTRLVDVTPFGARFRLKRPTESGRVLLLTSAMPRQLRCFDHIEDQYRVWSLVRHVTMLDSKTENGAVIEVGLAFIGKRPPASFANDPATRYDIANLQSGLWAVAEGQDALTELDDQDHRGGSRHTIPLEVTIEVYGDDGKFSEIENTVTENISTTGAAVFTALNLDRGRFLRMSSRDGFEVIAVVRRRTVGADGIARLHLQFIGREWPL
jgi:hypothetical protein